jgi:hypothetical protein
VHFRAKDKPFCVIRAQIDASPFKPVSPNRI